MKDILDDVERWINQGHLVALATVVSTQGSSPRELGAVMAVRDDGEVAGSISGGCVEAAVVEEALAVISEKTPRLLTYGVADELGFEVGLTCGGTIRVFVERLESDERNLSLSAIFNTFREASNQSFVLCTIVEGKGAGAKMIVKPGGEKIGSLGSDTLDAALTLNTPGFLAQGTQDIRYLDDNAVFIQAFTPPTHLIIFGAVDFTRSLSRLAKLLGYRVTICDPRSSLATPQRFPEADEIIIESPSKYLTNTTINDRTIIAVLTHDPKFDVPILKTAVRTQAAYIGAMGSRKATADRLVRLREAGLTDAEIDRINAPIGLDIGARTPDETAISIMAEIIAQRSGRSGGKLSLSQHPIHPQLAGIKEETKVC